MQASEMVDCACDTMTCRCAFAKIALQASNTAGWELSTHFMMRKGFSRVSTKTVIGRATNAWMPNPIRMVPTYRPRLLSSVVMLQAFRMVCAMSDAMPTGVQ